MNIDNSKVIKTVNNFYNTIQKGRTSELTSDEEFLLRNMEMEFAKSIIQEFGNVSANKLASIILSVTE